MIERNKLRYLDGVALPDLEGYLDEIVEEKNPNMRLVGHLIDDKLDIKIIVTGEPLQSLRNEMRRNYGARAQRVFLLDEDQLWDYINQREKSQKAAKNAASMVAAE